MASDEDIKHAHKLLAIARQNLAHGLVQAAAYGGLALSPPVTSHGIREARAQITDLKARLRAWNVVVEDMPDDTASPAEAPHEAPSPAQAAPIFHFHGPIQSGVANFGGNQTIAEV